MKYLACLILVISMSSSAEHYSHVGYIDRLGSIDSRENADYVILKNFVSAGSCPKANGFAIARIRSDSKGDRSFSIALAARMAGKKLKVDIDDTRRNAEGDCYLHSIEIVD